MTKYLDRDKLLEKLQQQKNWYNSDNSFFSDDLKVHLINSVNVIINQVNNGVFDIKANDSETYVSWLPEEDLWCVTRFIEHYFERLIKFGSTINSTEMALEVKLYCQRYGFKRTNDSVILKFHNIEYLAFKFVVEHGNPYDIEIKRGMSQISEQCLKFWDLQTKKYAQTILKWLKINPFKQEQVFVNEIIEEPHMSWLPEEDLWCVTRFIEHYFERLIKFGRTINSKEMALELKLYQEHFANNRKENSVILKFHNVEHLGFNLIIEYGNPYNIKIKKGMTAKTKQSVIAWIQQTAIYAEKINQWFNIS
ncbi:hypothetical protein [Spiroplasma attinicola]|uniref:hypothetical protein n=1 Tax=Spiroplasma attinicola TaxID=2904537 RepID=UPI002022B1C0|nr:hypothetical protein [Spiroplasma sp. JKS002670]MCL8209655.1 hypothetical protein [Spiroplasma sp. JKS002670]